MTDKPDEVAELVEVTHADIDALHAAYTEQWGKPAFAVYNADHWLAKAFARHRIATLTTLSRRNAELEAVVSEIASKAADCERINLIGKCPEAAIAGTLRKVIQIARAALGGSTDVKA